jgi:hypothetical protein
MDMHAESSRTAAGYIRAVLPAIVLLFLSLPAGAFSLDSTLTESDRPPAAPILTPSDSISAATDSTAVDTMMSVWSIDELNEVLTTESMVGGEPGRGGKKNSRVAVLSALVFPGLGQVYNERPVKAAIAFGLEMFYFSEIYFEYRNAERERLQRDRYEPGTPDWIEHDIWMNEYEERMIDWVWWSAFAVLLVTLDAYVDAHLYDMRFEIEGRALDRGAGVELVFDF